MSDFDREAMAGEQLDRELALMRACWTFFDLARARVSPELQREPRGGGRDRDQIVRHTMVVEQDWGKGLGLPAPERVLDGQELHDYRDQYCATILDYHDAGKISGKWPLRYLVRHTAYHTLNHAWEMEDKDLTGKA